MLGFLKIVTISVLLLGPYVAVAKTETPPVGKRLYLDGENPYAPVEIKVIHTKDKLKSPYMRDPGHNDRAKVKVVATPKKKPVVKKKKYKSKRIRFKSVAVQGRMTEPRVKFSRERLPLRRADEALDVDFYEKIFTETSGEL